MPTRSGIGAPGGSGRRPESGGGRRSRDSSSRAGRRGADPYAAHTKAHPYEREPYYQMFDSMGADITWMHVDHPAAEAFMTPRNASRYDVALFYDMNGAQADLGRSRRDSAPNNPFSCVPHAAGQCDSLGRLA